MVAFFLCPSSCTSCYGNQRTLVVKASFRRCRVVEVSKRWRPFMCLGPLFVLRRRQSSTRMVGCCSQRSWTLRPPSFEFLVIFDFFAPWYIRRRDASSVKISLNNSKEKLVKCATEVARLHKVSIQSCTQKRLSPKVQSLSRDWI